MNNELQPRIKDIIEITAKTLLSEIPVGGALITNVWDYVKSNSAQKRLNDWQSTIEERLSHIDKSLEEIGNNDNFTTAIFHATEMAIKTAEAEKRTYLANAVMNSISLDIEESIMMMFLSIIEKYTIMHIKILIYLKNPQEFVDAANILMGSPKRLLYQAYPEFEEYDKLVDKITGELHNDGLISLGDLNSIMSSNGMLLPRTTELGNRFVAFICNN